MLNTSVEHLPTKKLSFTSIQDTPFRKLQGNAAEEEDDENENEEQLDNEEENDENEAPKDGETNQGRKQKSSLSKDEAASQTALEVYLRIRPRTQAEECIQSIFTVEDAKTIGVKAPQVSYTILSQMCYSRLI